MVYYKKHVGGSVCYLVKEDRAAEFIDFITGVQTAAKTFCNISAKPYRGEKYAAYGPGLVWVIVG